MFGVRAERKGDNVGFKDTYLEAWTSAWGLHKQYHGIQATDEEQWKALDKACEQIAKKYESKPEQKFVENLLLAVVAELERSSNHE